MVDLYVKNENVDSTFFFLGILLIVISNLSLYDIWDQKSSYTTILHSGILNNLNDLVNHLIRKSKNLA